MARQDEAVTVIVRGATKARLADVGIGPRQIAAAVRRTRIRARCPCGEEAADYTYDEHHGSGVYPSAKLRSELARYHIDIAALIDQAARAGEVGTRCRACRREFWGCEG